MVIPCYQGSDKLALTVAALDRQTYPSQLLSVVVVDDGVPTTAEDRRLPTGSASRWPVRNGSFGIARARNLGAASSDI